MLVSLDGQPLSSSTRVLLQVMTEDAAFGQKAREIEADEGEKLLESESLGTPPMNVRNAAGLVSLRCGNPARWDVAVLDADGYPRNRPLKMMATDHTLTIQLEPDILYYVLKEQPR